jgi:alkylated DNA repair protein (DNA oxidative demethylase)
MLPGMGATAPPPGFRYVPDFLSASEEAALVEDLGARTFDAVRMRGVVARRQTLHFGWVYGYESWRITPGPALPAAYDFVLARAAALVGVARQDWQELLLSRYPPGAGIGWHRDAPMFGPVVLGVSLGAPCRFRLRRRLSPRRFDTYGCLLEPRSAYVLGGEARATWQHSIPEVATLRYSLTLRTLLAAADAPPRSHQNS